MFGVDALSNGSLPLPVLTTEMPSLSCCVAANSCLVVSSFEPGVGRWHQVAAANRCNDKGWIKLIDHTCSLSNSVVVEYYVHRVYFTH